MSSCPVPVPGDEHEHRVKAAEDSLRAATVEFSSAVDSRVDVLAGAAESTAALSELLVQVQASLEEKPALLTAQVEQELKAPLAKIAALEKSLDVTLRNVRDGSAKVRRREILAALLTGVALGAISAIILTHA